MIIEFNSPHSLNMGEDFEYIATFIKGKIKGQTKIENYRIVTKGVNLVKKLYFFYLIIVIYIIETYLGGLNH